MNDFQEKARRALAQFFLNAKDQYGNAISSFWFYEPDPCPGCNRSIDAMRHKGKRAISMNTFIHRERGILIGYFLCGRCGNKINSDAAKNPGVKTKLHEKIETNLKAGYERKLN